MMQVPILSGGIKECYDDMKVGVEGITASPSTTEYMTKLNEVFADFYVNLSTKLIEHIQNYGVINIPFKTMNGDGVPYGVFDISSSTPDDKYLWVYSEPNTTGLVEHGVGILSGGIK